MLLTTDSKQQAFFRIKKFHVRILYIKRAIIGGWDLASVIRHANIAVEFLKQTVSEPVKYVTPVFFP